MRQDWLESLADSFAAGFQSSTPSWRKVGREAEHPVVDSNGEAADIAGLWEALAAPGDMKKKFEGDLLVQLDGERFSYAAEVGKGTMEIVLAPSEDLHGIKTNYEEARDRLLDATSPLGLRVLGYGIQPKTAPTRGFMAPKQRYGVLLDVIGDTWLWFTLTASDQVHVELGRDEIVPAANLTNALSAVTVGLCANSPVYLGQAHGICSAREARMATIYAEDHRHGMPAAPARDLPHYIGQIARQPYLMERVDGAMRPVGQPFEDWLEAHGGARAPGAFEAFELHDHYIWNSGRPRNRHGTIELRSACQQPPEEHMASAALSLGMVVAAPALAELLDQRLGADAWEAMRRWHHDVIQDGLAAAEPLPGLMHEILDRVETGLWQRGRGEERYMAPLRKRADDRENPAQRALITLRTQGLDAMIERVTLR